MLRAWNFMYTINPAPFDYLPVQTLDEAVKLLHEYGESAKVVAGGQSLLLLMRKRLITPKVLIDLNKINGLNYVQAVNDQLLIGALTTFSDVINSKDVFNDCPILYEAARTTADVQVRNRATIGGNLAEAAPGANIPPVLLVSDAKIVIKSSSGEKIVRAEDLFLGPYRSALSNDEIIREIQIPLVSCRGYSYSYYKVARRKQEFGILVGALLIKFSEDKKVLDVKLAFGNATSKPTRLKNVEEELIDKVLTNDLVERVSSRADSNLDIRSTAAASAEYRRNLVRVYTKRLLIDAARRAGVM